MRLPSGLRCCVLERRTVVVGVLVEQRVLNQLALLVFLLEQGLDKPATLSHFT